MTKEHTPEKLGDVYKLLLNSSNAALVGDNSYNFKVNFAHMTGDVVRCVVRSGVIPPPATYITRRLWFADGNTWKNSFTDPQGKVNDFDTMLAKYGLNVWIYLYYPRRNMFLRILWNNTENTQVRQTLFSQSFDGVNWSASSVLSALGLSEGVHFSGGGNIPFDCYEIDTIASPRGLYIQNIHCPNLTAMRSYSTATQSPTDIIGHVDQGNAAVNPYALYSLYSHPFQSDVNNQVAGNTLRATRSLNIYFSRVATPTVKEPVPVLPWSLELNFYTDKR